MKPDIEQTVRNLKERYWLFFKAVWPVLSPEQPVWNWHIEAIAAQLQKLGAHIIHREPAPFDMIINLPPGMTKSSLVTQAFPVWLWLHDPTICIITSSYADGLAIDNSLKARSIIESDEFYWFQEYNFKPLFGEPLGLHKDTEKYWINNCGGWYYATSTRGTVTGKHAHLIIRDDPLNPNQADSEADRAACNRFNDRTLATRKKNKEVTPTITVMQRLHDDDPTGHDLKKENKRIFHICIPAEISDAVKPVEWKKFYKDGLLDPVRLSAEVLRSERIELGAYAYSGQYGQVTKPEDGGKIRRDWFEYIAESQLPGGLTRDLWIDGAYTRNRENDPTGLMVAGYSAEENRLYIVHATDDYLEMPELLERIPDYCDQTGVNTTTSQIRIEPKATGLTLKQLLNADTDYNAVSIRNHLVAEGKEARIQIAAPKVQSGRVVLVRGAWNDAFTDQLCTFPNALHDEFVDLLGYAVEHYFPKRKKETGEKKKPVSKEALGFY